MVELLEVGDDCLPLRLHVGADGLALAVVGQIGGAGAGSIALQSTAVFLMGILLGHTRST